MPGRHDTWNELTLARGALSLTLLPGVGGRLWDVALDGASLLFRNPDLLGVPVDPGRLDTLPTRSPQFGFPLWGGEKTWIAPDSDWPGGAPHPVLDSGPYRVTTRAADMVAMESRICPASGLRITRTVRVVSPTAWRIEHRVRNMRDAPRDVGIWSVMMLDHPTFIGVPTPQPDIVTVFGAHEGKVAPCPAGIVAACDDPGEFKVALPNAAGRVLIRAARQETWLLCETAPVGFGDVFAHAAPLEIFNSADYPYCEAEWHAPLETLRSGEEVSFWQTFRIWRGTSPPAGLTLSDEERELMTCMF